jgi:hypothetical protein
VAEREVIHVAEFVRVEVDGFLVELQGDGSIRASGAGVAAAGKLQQLLALASVLRRVRVKGATTRRCAGRCKLELPLEAFVRNRSRPDGRGMECADCHRAQVKASYQRHRAAIGQKKRLARQQQRPEARIDEPEAAPTGRQRKGRVVVRCKVCGACPFRDAAIAHVAAEHRVGITDEQVETWFYAEGGG